MHQATRQSLARGGAKQVHSVIKRINQRKVRLEVHTFSTESQITDFSISSDSRKITQI